MAEIPSEQARLSSMKELFPDYQEILTGYQKLLEGLLGENLAEVYDMFMEREGYQWSEQEQQYINNPPETDIRLISRLNS